MQYHLCKDISEGYTRLVGPGEGGLQYLEVGILQLPAGASYSSTPEGAEVALVILSARPPSRPELGGQADVFRGPGYRLYYLWALAGEERRMQPHDDPDHEWVSEAW